MDVAKLPDIRSVSDLEGKYVLLRASANVPIEHGVVKDTFRLVQTLETIKYLVSKRARVIVIAHIGREPEETLAPVFTALQQEVAATWSGETVGDAVTVARNELQDGEVLVLENLRRNEGEPANDSLFAKELAALGDLYVNDAFSDSHRAHASIVGIPALIPAYFGPNFIREYEALMQARVPLSPSLFILGGAKFETKLPLVEQYLKSYDHVFIGGALAHDVWRAKGVDVGASLTSDVDLTGTPVAMATNLLLPVDVVVRSGDTTRVCLPEEVKAEEAIMDAGPKTVELLRAHIASAQTILWNGPVGNYEAGFDKSTKAIAKLIAEAPGHSIVGGGDTVAAISTLGIAEEFDFVSSAGGAMLHLLEHGTLPAIDAIVQ